MLERLAEPRDKNKNYSVRNILKLSDSEIEAFDNWRFFLAFPEWLNAVIAFGFFRLIGVVE